LKKLNAEPAVLVLPEYKEVLTCLI